MLPAFLFRIPSPAPFLRALHAVVNSIGFSFFICQGLSIFPRTVLSLKQVWFSIASKTSVSLQLVNATSELCPQPPPDWVFFAGVWALLLLSLPRRGSTLCPGHFQPQPLALGVLCQGQVQNGSSVDQGQPRLHPPPCTAFCLTKGRRCMALPAYPPTATPNLKGNNHRPSPQAIREDRKSVV